MVEHGGFLLGSPVGVAPRTNPKNPSVRIKCAGFDAECMGDTTPPQFEALPAAWFPDGSTWHARLTQPILAMTLGIDIFKVTTTTIPAGGTLDGNALVNPMDVGVLQPPGSAGDGGWLALQFSVIGKKAKLAVGTGELAADIEAAITLGDVDATVFSYLVPGSDVEPGPEGHVSVRALSPDALELNPDDAIDGLNMHMALYHTDLPIGPGSSFFTGTLPEEPTVYFTLHPDFIAEADFQNWMTDWGLGAVKAQGTIFQSSWDVEAGVWTPPSVFLDWTDFKDKARRDDIVGLAISRFSDGTPKEMLFSTSGASAEDQLEFHSFASASPTSVRVVMPDEASDLWSAGVRIGAGVGLGDFCTKDPEMLSRARPRAVLDDFFVARRRPGAPVIPAPVELSVSAYRQLIEGRAGMRTCMDWRREEGRDRPNGTAMVFWGTILNYAVGATHIPDLKALPAVWDAVQTIPFTGEPLVADRAFPDGLPGEAWRHALAAQWSLVYDDGRIVTAPLCILRMWQPPALTPSGPILAIPETLWRILPPTARPFPPYLPW